MNELMKDRHYVELQLLTGGMLNSKHVGDDVYEFRITEGRNAHIYSH